MDGKKPHNGIELTLEDTHHKKLMVSILRKLADTPMILKGGTALYLGYGLNRFSEDLDFDCHKKMNLVGRLKSAIPDGIILNEIYTKKDTDTAGRYVVSYHTQDDQETRLLVVEVSYRNAPPESEVNLIDGMRIASIKCLIDNKLRAAFDGQNIRTKAKDLFDLHFLAKNYAGHFTPDFARRLMEFSQNPDELVSLYENNAKNDSILNKIMDTETIVLELNAMATDLHNKHSRSIATPQHLGPPTPPKRRRK
ncbi:nucleotidyl transferase AbiEii/AbiGii toxin family protein [Helicobacter bizzozeronii]|uniref:nucleotidyl transferase AbiEii/AbiGii toxin family protein n=1 Tax=Helicobacter bizzozeronii TaxID=56877 RepID=UPI000CEF1782|nr:nucleotidyl transferase AbiEii/AbiGii toxin family protein [Helicobacter bizzozeronii]